MGGWLSRIAASILLLGAPATGLSTQDRDAPGSKAFTEAWPAPDDGFEHPVPLALAGRDLSFPQWEDPEPVLYRLGDERLIPHRSADWAHEDGKGDVAIARALASAGYAVGIATLEHRDPTRLDEGPAAVSRRTLVGMLAFADRLTFVFLGTASLTLSIATRRRSRGDLKSPHPTARGRL